LNQVQILQIINAIFDVISGLIIVRIVFSWLMIDRYSNELTEFVYTASDIFLKPFRVIVSIGMGGIDLSPIIAFIVLRLLREIITNLIL